MFYPDRESFEDIIEIIFTRSILSGKPIKVFNEGNQERDFTYVDDIVAGLIRILEEDTSTRSKEEMYLLFNIGKGKPVGLMPFIAEIENQLGKKALQEMAPKQPGDVSRTWANTEGLQKRYSYSPETDLKEGISEFITWYKDYYKNT